jgi:hypothetical protein
MTEIAVPARSSGTTQVRPTSTVVAPVVEGIDVLIVRAGQGRRILRTEDLVAQPLRGSQLLLILGQTDAVSAGGRSSIVCRVELQRCAGHVVMVGRVWFLMLPRTWHPGVGRMNVRRHCAGSADRLSQIGG